MEEIIILSDNHGEDECFSIIEKRHPGKLMLHLGDLELKDGCLNGKNIEIVRGNSFFDPEYPLDLVIERHGLKILMTHGHKYSVKTSRDSLAREAASLGIGLALYGHTHVAKSEYFFDSKVHVFCPGSVARSYGAKKTYASLEILDDNQYIIYLRELYEGDILWKSH